MEDLTASDSESENITRAVLTRRRSNTNSSHHLHQHHQLMNYSQTSVSTTSYSPSKVQVIRPVKTTLQDDGHRQSFWKKCVETILILVPLVLASEKSPLMYHPSYQLLLIEWIVVTVTAFFFRFEYASFPQTLYLLLFPPMLSLATGHADLLPLNVTLSLTALPMPFRVLEGVAVAMLGESMAMIPELHLYVCQVIEWSCTTSLTFTEVSLFASLLVNVLQWFHYDYSQIVILLSLVSLIPSVPFLQRLTQLSKIMGPHKRPPNAAQLKQSYAFLSACSFGVSLTCLLFILLGMDGVNQLIRYMFYEPIQHLYILGYWGAILSIAIPTVLTHSHKWQLDLRRKVWHGIIVVMFLPTCSYDYKFVSVCMCIAIVVFLLLEIMRATTMPPFGQYIHTTLLPYTDSRDLCGPVIVSHVFLLLGISLPVMLSKGSPAGIICLGLGDASASIVGRRYGQTRKFWLGTPKTIEGTVSFMIMVVLGLQAASYLDVRLEHLTLSAMCITAVATAMLEATSGMNDNVIVPLYMLIVLELLI